VPGYGCRSAMKHLIPTLLIVFLLVGTLVNAEETKRIPTFKQLEAVAGRHSNAEELKALLRDFDFSENPKRERSWGSGFGVFLEQSKTGIVNVGVRPPSRMTNMPTYLGMLPKQLEPEDTVESIERKLGKPDRTAGEGDGQLIMHYDGFHIITLGRQLSEIWLTEFEPQAEQSNAPKYSKTRFDDGKSSARTR